MPGHMTATSPRRQAPSWWFDRAMFLYCLVVALLLGCAPDTFLSGAFQAAMGTAP